MILWVAADLQRWLMLAETIDPRQKKAIQSCTRQLTMDGKRYVVSCEVRHTFSQSNIHEFKNSFNYLTLSYSGISPSGDSGHRIFPPFDHWRVTWSLQTFLEILVPPVASVTQKQVTTWRRCETDGSWRWWFASCTLYLGLATLCNVSNILLRNTVTVIYIIWLYVYRKCDGGWWWMMVALWILWAVYSW